MQYLGSHASSMHVKPSDSVNRYSSVNWSVACKCCHHARCAVTQHEIGASGASKGASPRRLFCSHCGRAVGQCRLCRIEHLQKERPTSVRPPEGSATLSTHRCKKGKRRGVSLQFCSERRCVRYCDKVCQKKDCKCHKRICGHLKTMPQLHFV